MKKKIILIPLQLQTIKNLKNYYELHKIKPYTL